MSFRISIMRILSTEMLRCYMLHMLPGMIPGDIME